MEALNYLTLLFFCCCCCCCCFLVNGVTALSSDGHALLAFKRLIYSSTTELWSWKPSDETPCNWSGVSCGSHGRVVSLSLSNMFLGGSIPAELSNLSELTYLNLSFTNTSGIIPPHFLSGVTKLQILDLSSNAIVGSIPFEIGSLVNLEELHLHGNGLEGVVPSTIAQCFNLRILHLHDNNLTGSLPSELGNLTRLESLRVGGNADLGGSLPPELSRCRNLTTLGTAATSISGTIPPSFGNLYNLVTLSLYNTRLSGSIPPELGNCSSLQYIYLHINQLSGGIPPQLGRLNQLTNLLLWGNNFNDPIPPAIGNCSSLRTLDISMNQLTGTVPKEIGKLKSLQQLYLSDNNLGGSIPEEIGECTNLIDLQFDKNTLSGSIPSSLSHLSLLQNIFLWQNNLTGPIPSSLGNCSELQVMDFSHNQLSGEMPKEIFLLKKMEKIMLLSNHLTGGLPPEVGECISLTRLRLGSNRLSGNIPRQVGKLQNLIFLDIYSNQFNGVPPLEIWSITSLELFDAHQNHLTGILPSELGLLTNLQQLDLSENDLSGSIPTEVGRLRMLNKLVLGYNMFSGSIPSDLKFCQKLALVDLSHNQLSGTIPPELGNIISLDITLDLSWNDLSGQIPEEIGGLTQLQSLDLSHNQLSGSLEVLQFLDSLTFLNVSSNKFTGILPNTPFFNTLAPSAILDNPGLCDPAGSVNSCSPMQHFTDSTSRTVAIYFLTFGLAAIFFVVGLFFILRLRRKAQNDMKQHEATWLWSLTQFRRLNFTMDDILDGLRDENIIGRGCSGVVYRAEMPSGETVAVKKLWASNKEDQHDTFASEVETLGHICHRNIVRLLGYCTNRNEKLLLYNFMPNGNLDELLFARRGMVDWEIRYKIIVEAAQGLAYLHHDCAPAIIHRDVKSNNILLDSKFQPYLADFGLAKVMESSQVRADAMSKVAGSYGYIAPEYGYTLKITEKSDVFSYGVVVLEVLTGRRAVEPNGSDGLHIVEWVKTMKKYRPILEILDPRLRGMADHLIQEMEQTLGVALLCVNPNPAERPTMKDVAALLLEVTHPLEEFSKLSQPLIKS